MENTFQNSYEEEIVAIIRECDSAQIEERLADYHDNDIAAAFELLDSEERKNLYEILGAERMSEIFSYIEDISDYVEEFDIEQLADVIEQMDADDAIDVLEDVDEDVREELIAHMDEEAQEDIQLITSYDDDQVGSQMTTNYIVINEKDTIKQAMRKLVSQAEKNDNINTIYVEDANGQYYGAVDLTALITAREYVELSSLIATSYPVVSASERISDCIEYLRDYAEDSIPVVNDKNEIIGVITALDLVEMVDDQMGDDYAKFAGLTEQSDLDESVKDSMKKRLPWLILLLFLGMGVSTVVGVFEGVVSQIALIVCFQSLILDMAGNVGTQSLAVTIRVLVDEDVSAKQKLGFVGKELRIGICNGLLLGALSFAFISVYIMLVKGKDVMYAMSVSGCVGISLLVAMMISSLVGTLIPMFFHKIKVDPAVASGPLITTVNDLVAVMTYYGLSGFLLIHLLQITS